MTELLNNFDICRDFDENVKQNVKVFYIFDSNDGKNMFFITSDDKVFSFRSNSEGVLGFEHKQAINVPQIVPELCDKNIIKFINGYNFMFALGLKNAIYIWGQNSFSNVYEHNVTLSKPIKLDYFDDKNIIQISCGKKHVLMLSANGMVYVSGNNGYGQCGIDQGEDCVQAQVLEFSKHDKCKYVQCSLHSSFALTFDGKVYAWGLDEGNLGHAIDSGIAKPKLINLLNIDKICAKRYSTYLLSNENVLYFCGQTNGTKHDIPVIVGALDSEERDVKTVVEVQNHIQKYEDFIITAKSYNKSLYELNGNNFSENSNFDNFDKYYAKKLQITYRTIDTELNKFVQEFHELDKNLYNYKKSDLFQLFSRQTVSELKSFYIFDKYYEKYIIFTTNEDLVYGFGSYKRDDIYSGPQLENELTHKQLKLIDHCENDLVGVSESNGFFIWSTSQANNDRYYPSSENFSQLSCGDHHFLALTNEGNIYGWGFNFQGQVIRHIEDTNMDYILNLVPITYFKDEIVTKVYCYDSTSIAITNDGNIYSWGEECINDLLIEQDHLYNEGSQLESNEFFTYQPRIFNLPNIQVIDFAYIPGEYYFLTKDGVVFHYLIEENKLQTVQSIKKCIAIQSSKCTWIWNEEIGSTQKVKPYVTGLLEDGFIYELDSNELIKTDYKNFEDYYLEEYFVTNTVIFNENYTKYNRNFRNSNDSEQNIFFLEHYSKDSKFLKEFEIFSKIGSGNFGTVFKVRSYLDEEYYAIKTIRTNINNNSSSAIDFGKINLELNILRQLDYEGVVKYFSSWSEQNIMHIQMELCQDSLKNILEYKPRAFGRTGNEELNSYEFFISCELFIELLECVQYLHELKPLIIHRDLKPENILIKDMNNGKYLKLCDFGLATYQVTSETGYHSQGPGTIKYTAPEVSGGTKYNEKADVYSLSIIGQQIFDIDIQASEIYACNSNCKLAMKRSELINVIGDMFNHLYHRRPSCRHVLSGSSKWRFTANEIIENKLFGTIPDILEWQGNEFYRNMFKTKLKFINNINNLFCSNNLN